MSDRNNINENFNIAPVQDFIQLSDVPNSYLGQAGLYPIVNNSESGLIFSNAVGPQGPPGATTFVGLTDGPGAYGLSGQFLTSVSNSILWGTPSFIGLSDTPSAWSSISNNQICYANRTSNTLVFTDLSNLTENYVYLSNLKDVQNGSPLDGQTIIYDNITQNWKFGYIENGNSNSNVLTFGLTELDDYTGNGYVPTTSPSTSGTVRAGVAVNSNNTGFEFLDCNRLLNSRPYINFGMNKGGSTYPSPYNQGFTYDQSDRSGAGGVGYFYFGTNRINYSETPYLNSYWTILFPTGSTYAMTGGVGAGDFGRIYVGVNNSLTCGVDLNYPQIAPLDTWYMDIEYNISARIELQDISNNLFCVWVQTQADMDGTDFNLSTSENLIKRADVLFMSESTSNSYPNGICVFNINKIITIPAGTSNNISKINVFMNAFNQSNKTILNNWRIRSYYYINVSARIIGFHSLPKVFSQPYPS
jgi:hypothetical protein